VSDLSGGRRPVNRLVHAKIWTGDRDRDRQIPRAATPPTLERQRLPASALSVPPKSPLAILSTMR
jgi:hypothetical protein